MLKPAIKIVMVFVLVGIMVFVLCGCIDNPAVEDIKPSVTILSNEDPFGNDAGNKFFYIVDNRTGVVYLGFSCYRKAGITVMLNADGSPVTYDQIKEERKAEND